MKRSVVRVRSVHSCLWVVATVPVLACQIEVESPPEDEAWLDDVSGVRPIEPPQPPDRGRWSEDRSPQPPVDERPPPAPQPLEPSLPASLYRDLIVIEPALVNGPRADSTEADAPFSFRSQMEWLAGASREPFDFTRSWLERWENANGIGPELAPVTPRPAARALLIDSWLGASTEIEAETASGTQADSGDPSYGSEGEGPLGPTPSWANVPFQLIAIVNRVDLASEPCSGFAGELRYVYSALDPATAETLDMTLILEVPYPTSRPAAEWARLWSSLATLPPGEEYEARLEQLTREVQREGDPLRARLRSNEIALADADSPGWELREFQLEIHSARLELVPAPLEFTPRADLDPALLAEYVLEHAEELRTSGVSLPEAWRAGAAGLSDPSFSWPVLGVSERLRQAFSVQTCNGCHGGDTATLPFRHIEPGASVARPARLSRFLYDPEAPSDELRRRAARLQALSAAVCETPEPASGYPGE